MKAGGTLVIIAKWVRVALGSIPGTVDFILYFSTYISITEYVFIHYKVYHHGAMAHSQLVCS